jgi:hypothetical protein
MKARWIALGVVGFAVCLVAVFGVVYTAIELAEDDSQTQAIVIDREQIGPIDPPNLTTIRWCVTYNLLGTEGKLCKANSRFSNDVSRRRGHASAAFTMDTYAQLLKGQQRQAAEALDHLLAQA